MRLYQTLNVHSTKTFKNFLIFLIPSFLVLLADSILSYTFPIIVEQHLNSNFLMGVIMSASSIVGITTDLILPKYFQHGSWRKLMLWGIVLSFGFPIFQYFGTQSYPFIFFLMATAIWGVYFEFLSFAQQDFIVSKHNKAELSRDWGIISGVWYLNNLLAPIIGAGLLASGIVDLTTTLIAIIGMSLITTILMVSNHHKKQKDQAKLKSHVERSIEFIKEIYAIREISKSIFPLVLVSFISTCINAAFWTIGGLYGIKLSNGEFPEWLVIGLFSFSTLISSVYLTIRPINSNIRNKSEISLLIAGALLILLAFNPSTLVTYLIILISTFFLGFVRPLNDSLFSELSQRNFNNEMYFISISRMTISMSYVVTPLILGVISDVFSYEIAFAFIGFIGFITGLYVISKPDKNFRLPEKKIREIEES